MIDIRQMRENPEALRESLKAKKCEVDLTPILHLDSVRRELSAAIDTMNQQRNAQSKALGPRIKAGENVEDLKEEVRQLGEQIKHDEAKIAVVDAELRDLLLQASQSTA